MAFSSARLARGLSTTSFESLGLSPALASAVRRLGLRRPSAAQALAVPTLLTGESVAFASSTGSGAL